MATETDVPGFPLNYGVFQNYYSTHAPFAGNPNLSTVGTFGTAFYFLGAPIACYLVRRYHRWQREIIWTGWFMTMSGVASASWAQDFGSLVGTQGVLFGFGILVVYYPIYTMLNEWFIEKRGLALGIICASTGVTGLFFPFALEVLLSKYGPPTTLRVCAIAFILLTGPVLPMLKGRLPKSHHEEMPALDYSFLRMPQFYFFAIATLLQGMGFYFPNIYLPSYASSLGLGNTLGALLLVVYSFAQVLGQIGFGYFSDLRVNRFGINERLPVSILVFISTLVSGIAILTMWGLATTFPLLVVFVIFYGIFAGGFVVTWARMTTTISESPSLALTIFAYFPCVRGVGNVIIGPVSSAIFSPNISVDEYAIGGFRGIVLYSGICMLASATTMVIWWTASGLVRCMRRKGEFCGCPA
ncbi:MAG: hypothetical protein Q9222_006547 [Ikaeria aurantiellina]